MRALEATRTLRELESNLLSRNAYAILEQQRAIERSVRELGAYDTAAALAKAGLQDNLCGSRDSRRWGAPPSCTSSYSAWTEMQQRIKILVTMDPLVRWEEITRGAAAWGVADSVARQLARGLVKRCVNELRRRPAPRP
jgi:hypothetical protein